MIQGVVGRIASEVQTFKTLAITVAAGVIALAQASSQLAPKLMVASILIILTFWGQTAYSLHVERSYRKLYDLVREDKFPTTLSMNWRDAREGVANWWQLLLTPSVLLPYLAVVVVLIFAAYTVDTSVIGKTTP
jgi:hypothetical protein